MNNFKQGDVVRVKSGGPSMVVKSVNGDYVECIWMDAHGVYENHFKSIILEPKGDFETDFKHQQRMNCRKEPDWEFLWNELEKYLNKLIKETHFHTDGSNDDRVRGYFLGGKDMINKIKSHMDNRE